MLTASLTSRDSLVLALSLERNVSNSASRSVLKPFSVSNLCMDKGASSRAPSSTCKVTWVERMGCGFGTESQSVTLALAAAAGWGGIGK